MVYFLLKRGVSQLPPDFSKLLDVKGLKEENQLKGNSKWQYHVLSIFAIQEVNVNESRQIACLTQMRLRQVSWTDCKEGP